MTQKIYIYRIYVRVYKTLLGGPGDGSPWWETGAESRLGFWGWIPLKTAIFEK